jgi:wyosine [tRNA(Phe)-imidazoG37] synthetase (radical SAM superfamily)
MNAPLSIRRHDRDAVGMTYVYPVVSRRSGGVSLGVNLNPNNVCNWRCIYCQVPDLGHGAAPEIDLRLLETELRDLLDRIVHGDFMATQVPEGARRLNDIALSGNGEPTTSKQFDAVVELIAQVANDFGLAGNIKLVLITNGSGVTRPHVRRGLARMAQLNGEVWFKLDRATRQGMRAVNAADLSPETVMKRLAACAGLIPTWIQTCVFALDGAPPAQAEVVAYLEFLSRARAAQIPLKGVLAYGLARPPMQPGSERLSNVPQRWVEDFAEKVQALGIEVRVSE